MPLVLNMPGFWICQGSEYTKVLNMPLVVNLPKCWIYHGSEYVRVTQSSEYNLICLIMSAWICLDLSEYVKICVNMPKSAWMNGFYFMFPYCNLLSTWTRAYLFLGAWNSHSGRWYCNSLLGAMKPDFFYSSCNFI